MRLAERLRCARVDIRASQTGWFAYLPHELTHILLDRRLIAGELPRWVDEGMALLADPPEKRSRHGEDLLTAMRDGRQYRLTELLALTDYPDRERLGVFYGQSLSLVEFLFHRGGGHKFASFVRRIAHDGYDQSLQAEYGIDSVAELESQWLSFVSAATTGSTAGKLASDHALAAIELAAAERAWRKLTVNRRPTDPALLHCGGSGVSCGPLLSCWSLVGVFEPVLGVS